MPLESGLPLFLPKRRQAILVNSYDVPEFCSPGVIECGHSRGSRRVYEMEGILTLDINLDDLKFSDPHKEWIKEMHLRPDADAIAKARKKIRYQALSRIQPYNNQKQRLENTLEEFARTSQGDDLTLMYATAHGEPGGFLLDGEIYPYADLIQQLDQIQGNKVMILMACYSGSILDVIDEKSKGKNGYLVQTSTGADEPGINWADDEMHNNMADHIAQAKPVSQLSIYPSAHTLEGKKPTPRRRGNFDAIL